MMNGVRWLVVLVLAGVGCAYDATGQGTGSGSGSGSGEGSATGGSGTSTGDAGSTGEAEGLGTTVGLDGSSSSGSGAGSASTTVSETDTGSTGEPPPTSRSCAEILEMDPSAATGMHSISSERHDAVVEVWCEMELDGGGWTLVARSDSGPEVPFGWGVSHGTVGDDSEPYSLGAMGLGLPFTEVLIGRRMGFATVVANAYVVEVPVGFVEEHREQAYEAEGARTVAGGCNPGGGPEMLRRLGYTDDEDKYFFRDLSGNDAWGLFSNGLRVYYDDCYRGGNLDDEHGVLFVR
jgi:hypothetical protein